MKNEPHTVPFWGASAFADTPDAMPPDTSALDEHLSSCLDSREEWGRLRHASSTVHGFVAKRFVTTMVVLALLAGISILLF
jgi:hypothetical protein